MLGKHYLVEHVIDFYNQEDKRSAYELYCSEMMRSLINSISAIAGGGELFPKSWKEMQEYKPEKRTAEEIKSSIIGGLQALGGS